METESGERDSLRSLLLEFEEAVLSVDKIAATGIFNKMRQGGDTIDPIERLVVPVLENIGRSWEEGKTSLSQVYMSGRICEELVEGVLPPDSPDRRDKPKMAIALLEDYHSLGKRMVYSVLRAGGFNLADYGRGSVKELVEWSLRDEIDILLISVLMLPSALKVKEVKIGLRAAGAKVKIGVGGAPFIFDDDLWTQVGADAMGRSSSEAVSLVNKLAGGSL
ncbi:MAG: cobalamin-binding protein [Proteobacteria bacterium]|nr:cobalamin-binding protein [Pseudomonadota bacterium]